MLVHVRAVAKPMPPLGRLPARGKWRVWCYRRHWAGVMTIAGAAPWYQGRTLLPVLGKVTATRYIDRVQVRLVSGQSAADIAKSTFFPPNVLRFQLLARPPGIPGQPGRRDAAMTAPGV